MDHPPSNSNSSQQQHQQQQQQQRASITTYSSEGRATGRRLGLQIATDRASLGTTVRQRSTTMLLASPVSLRGDPRTMRGIGGVSPDPLMPVDECSERIDRLLQRVQQKHREYTARQALTSPTPRTPTRFDQASTVSTVSLRSASESEQPLQETEPAVFSPRRRAATMDPAPSSPAAPVSSAIVGASSRGGSVAQRASAAEMRMKIERVRARRAAKLAEQDAYSGAWSPTAGSPPASMHSSLGAFADEGFFERSSVRALFREVPLVLKDVEWDKRVYYHHVAQQQGDAADDVEIRGCREECLVELLGRREAARVLARTGHEALLAPEDRLLADGLRPSGAEVDALADWIDQCSSGDDGSNDDDDDCRSFDWSRDGFGHVEFRRLSRMEKGGSPATPSTARTAFSPPAPEEPAQASPPIGSSERPGLFGGGLPATFGRFVAQRRSSLGLRPSATPSAQRPPQTLYADYQNALARIRESGDAEESGDDGDWQMLAFQPAGGRAARDAGGEGRTSRRQAKAELGRLRAENAEIREELEHAQRAIQALKRIYLRR
ncbi:hypothetical protein GGI07_000562 [Coemansia sp. Benny D115]|nr:hypothetical protein GGI07_000562 [Coemansia sp. Benny D115]